MSINRDGSITIDHPIPDPADLAEWYKRQIASAEADLRNIMHICHPDGDDRIDAIARLRAAWLFASKILDEFGGITGES